MIRITKYLNAANWVLKAEAEGANTGINIKRMPLMYQGQVDPKYRVTLFNASKSLVYEGFTHEEQELLKGLIVLEDAEAKKAHCVLAYCLPKFYNLGELS